mgnify:FL=1
MDKKMKKSYNDVEAVDILHQVSNFYISTKVPHDYGTGEAYTSVEVHTLKHIADHHGITVTELARDYGKTKGAVSQILKKVESKGLIYREVDSENDNRFHLFLTEKGKELNEAHRKYDEIGFGESMDIVREHFSEDEINTTFSVLEAWLDIRRKVQDNRNARKKAKKEISK